MIPIEVRVPSLRYENFDEEVNASLLAAERDMIEEQKEAARVQMMVQKRRMAHYYDAKIKKWPLKVGDTILRQVFQNTSKPEAGVLGYSWEWPYQITEVLKNRAYLAGIQVELPCNEEHLKFYYKWM